jgi:hypothetical protein
VVIAFEISLAASADAEDLGDFPGDRGFFRQDK